MGKSKSQKIIKNYDSSEDEQPVVQEIKKRKADEDEEDNTIDLTPNRIYFIDELVKALDIEDIEDCGFDIYGFFSNSGKYNGLDSKNGNHKGYHFYIISLREAETEEDKIYIQDLNVENIKNTFIGIMMYFDKKRDEKLISYLDNMKEKTLFKLKNCVFEKNENTTYGNYSLRRGEYVKLKAPVKLEGDDEYVKKLKSAFEQKKIIKGAELRKKIGDKHPRRHGDKDEEDKDYLDSIPI